MENGEGLYFNLKSFSSSSSSFKQAMAEDYKQASEEKSVSGKISRKKRDVKGRTASKRNYETTG